MFKVIKHNKKNCLVYVNKQINKNGFNRQVSTSSIVFQKNGKEENSKSKETDSFLINMFKGNLKLDCVFPYPVVLNQDQKETLSMYIPQATKLYKELNDPLLNDKNESLDPKIEKVMKEMGAFGVMTPAEYGGAEMNATQFARLAEIIGSNDLGISVHLGAHQSIGYKGIVLFGNEEQKKKYLPSLAAGEKLAAFCLTEPSSGSDASSIRTNAKLSNDGKHYILNGSKIWISNGGIASVFTVFAKTLVKNDKGQEKEKITAFIVERDFGVKSGPSEQKMGLKCSNTTEIYFENTKVPIENVLGEVGNGFKVAMNILNSGRFGMVAALTGSMKSLIEKSVEHANNRVQFGSKISTFGTIQEKLARMAMAHYTCESLAYMISGMMDKGAKDFQLEAAIGKICASESAWNVCDETIQTLGGMGYMREAGVEKVLRDLRIFRIFEGTNDILRLFIALTGLQYTGSHLKDLQKAIKNPVANLGYLFDQGTKRVIRSVGLSSGPSLSDYVAPELKSTAANVTKCMQNFTQASEKLLMKYNKDIIHEQFLLNRIANSAIDIYIMTVLLSRATNSIEKNFKSSKHEINIVKAICSEKCEQVEFNLLATKSSEKLKLYDRFKEISNNISVNSGVSHVHPIDEE